ncbi:hypothetical protein G5V57_30140 [Nordella sp. HKS 07]|uniref:hypothetical protein n=1 Tax=Nordella sp. HKS 07 TaxID=2712222 RepID=UPI0013E14FDB|nr:hypothetical protein [Nordella sp. HKS 07]QIG51601.1 hypothetical protein G5V57_30140 [Nordella sp. HKS 07]
MSDQTLLAVKGLDVSYHLDDDVFAALRDIGLTVRPGEIVGVVGESGCGSRRSPPHFCGSCHTMPRLIAARPRSRAGIS